MTSISSLFSFSASDLSGVSQASANSSSAPSAASQNPASTSDVFGAAYSFNLSNAAMGMLGNDSGGQCGGSSGDDALSALTYSGSSTTAQGSSSIEAWLINFTSDSSDPSTDSTGAADTSSGSEISQLMKVFQQMLSGMENSLEALGGTGSAQGVNATSSADAVFDGDTSTAAAEAALAGAGPLPTFIKMVDTDMHLNATQQQALQNIANENMDATNTPDSIQKIAMELQQAGI